MTAKIDGLYKSFFISSGGHLVTFTINHANKNLATEYDWIPILKQ